MLAVDLLKKRCICAEDTNEVLFRVLNEPLSQHLPRNSRIIGKYYTFMGSILMQMIYQEEHLKYWTAGVSNGLEKLVDMENYVSATSDDKNLVFVVCYIICFLFPLLS